MATPPEDPAQVQTSTESNDAQTKEPTQKGDSNKPVAEKASEQAQEKFAGGLRNFLKKVHNMPGLLTKDSWFNDLFINSWDNENVRIKNDLDGVNGPERMNKAKHALDQAKSELKTAKNAPGVSSWLDVCDPMFKVLIAYMAYRKAAGRADSVMGRAYDLLFKPMLIPFNYAEKVCKTIDRVIEKQEAKEQRDRDNEVKKEKLADAPEGTKKAPDGGNTTTPDPDSDPDKSVQGTMRI